MFLFLLLVGLGPAAFLPARVDTASRLALAPAFGLSVSMCVLVTTVWRVPLDHSAWLLPLLALASAGVAVWRWKRGSSEGRLRLRIGATPLIQLLVMTVLVMGSLNQGLVRRDSVGPVGYGVADAAGYVLEQDGMQAESIYAAARQHPPWRDLTIEQWHAYAGGFQQIGFDPVAAGADVLLGLGASATYSSFVVALLLVGAFAAWAAVRVVTCTDSWAAALAGTLVGGSFFIQLFMDGSQGAIAGLALVIPLLLAGHFALRRPSPTNLILFALLAAGLQTAYPLFVPPVAFGGAAVLAIVAVRGIREGATREELVRAVGAVVGVLVLAAALTPVAFERNVRYWHSILDGTYRITTLGLPQYDLPAGVLPGWLLQTRDFYYLPHLDALTSAQVPNSILIPILLLGVVAYGVWRYRAIAIALPIALAAGALAYYTFKHDQCSYCVQRNLLVIEPLAIVGVGVGVAALLMAHRPLLRVSAIAVAAIGLVAIGDKALDVTRREANAAYVFDRSTRQALSALPSHAPGSLELEGFGQGPKAQMEDPLVYAAAHEALRGPPSLAAESDDNYGLQYLGGPREVGAEFDPSYRFVLTRLGGIRNGRLTIARYGPIALQERVGPLDALVTSGVDVALARNDPRGRAWVQAVPITVWLTGANPSQLVWALLEFQIATSGPVSVGQSSGAVATASRAGSRLTVCLALAGSGALRRAAVPIVYSPIPQPPVPEEFGIPNPPAGVQLTGVFALARPCALSARRG